MSGVDVVIVSYNSRDLLVRACLSVAGLGEEANLVVVDNASSDGSPDAVRAAAPGARLLELAENVGFGRAANAGAALGNAPHLLLLNSDAELVGDAYSRLATELEIDGVAAVGPRIRDRDGRLELSTGRTLGLLNEALFKIGESLHRSGRGPASPLLERRHARARSTASLSAACLLLRREAFEGIGGFDERFFLYAEDVDLCLRLRSAGWRLRYRPDAVVLHQRGASGGDDEEIERHYRTSQLAFYAKHRSALSSLLLRAWLRARYRLGSWTGDETRRARCRRMLDWMAAGAPGRRDPGEAA